MKSAWVDELFPVTPEDEIRLLCLDRQYGNVQPYELYCIMRIIKSVKAKNIFEIGTFDGRTTRNMAANVTKDSNVYTLDLPSDLMPEDTTYPLDEDEKCLILKSEVGKRFKFTPEALIIKQLFGDSAKYDFSSYIGKMDVAFVDGSHVSDYVSCDSRTSFQLINPERGVVIWHDYGDEFPDVRNMVQKIAKERTDYEFYHLNSTLLVVALKLIYS